MTNIKLRNKIMSVLRSRRYALTELEIRKRIKINKNLTNLLKRMEVLEGYEILHYRDGKSYKYMYSENMHVIPSWLCRKIEEKMEVDRQRRIRKLKKQS